MLTHDEVRDYLWGQAQGEKLGLGRIYFVSRSQNLTDEERVLIERRVKDEINHVSWFRTAASKYGEKDLQNEQIWATLCRDYNTQVHCCSPEEMLIYAYVPERFAKISLDRAAKRIAEYGDKETAEMVRTACNDEIRHVDENSALLQRWSQTTPGLKQTFERTLRAHYHKDLFKSYGTIR